MEDIEKIKKYEPFWGTWYIDSFIGEGGFGSVYKIKREEFGEIHYCALKHIQIPQNDDEIRRITDEGADENSVKEYFKSVVEDIYGEIRLMAKLKGTSHIVSYEDHQIIPKENQIGYDIFIRMEYLTELGVYFASHNVSKADIIKLGIDLCAGLELCQKYNIIHRDIKPDNIYVAPSGDYKLGDFGISRQIEKTMSGLSRKGTIDYMAPEVYKGEKYNSTVDIYSVGLVMYRYLNNNRMPFMPTYPEKFTSRDRENAFTLRLSNKPFPPPQSANGRLAEIVLKACSYNMRDRYSSPTLMRMELEKIKYTREEKAIIYPAGDVIKLDSEKSEQSGKVAENKANHITTVKMTNENSPDSILDINEAKKDEKKPKKFSTAKIIGIVSSFTLICAAVLIFFIARNNNLSDVFNAGIVQDTITESDTYSDTTATSSENYVLQTTTPTESAIQLTISSTTETTLPETTTAAQTTATTTTAATTVPTTKTPTTTAIPTTTSLTGYSTQTYSNGDKYAGNFINGVRSGQGTYTWANGTIYNGEFVNGNPSGKGSYVYPTEATTTPIPTTAKPTQAPTTIAKPTEAPTNPLAVVPTLNNVVAISAGCRNSLAIKSDGSLWAWGWNDYGELGDGTTTFTSSPVKIMDGVKTVSAGNWHSLAIKSDGSLWAWGRNDYGQLGDGTTTNRLTPVKIMDGVKTVSAGNWHSLAIKSDGSLWAWGGNGLGELGDGTTTDRLTPVKITDGVTAVSAGDCSFAIKSDGSLWAWGANYDGRLGDGTTTFTSSPVKIMDGVTAVSTEFVHSFVIKSDGSLWEWTVTYTTNGELGDGTATYKLTPIKIMDGVKTASAGLWHSLAIKNDGSLWAWGGNGNGELGDGTTTDRLSPVKIAD